MLDDKKIEKFKEELGKLCKKYKFKLAAVPTDPQVMIMPDEKPKEDNIIVPK